MLAPSMKRAFLLCGLCLVIAFAAETSAAEGWRVFVCGHSFHAFVDAPLETLAREAGHANHRNVGKLFVGGSKPIDIWKLPDAKNTARTALATGEVDVLTLSPHELVPDPGVDLYAELAARSNPAARVFLQVSWSPLMMARPDPAFWRAASSDYTAVLHSQAKAINRRQGRDFVFVVPVGPAVITLWERIKDGQVPGVSRVNDLFTDPILHPGPVLKNLAAYCWFAAVYGESPVGLNSLDGRVSAATNHVLQQIAWDAVLAEPMSGVSARPLVSVK